MDIRDRVIIVTGASSGIGLATARLLAQQGAKVALVARSQGRLAKLSRELPYSLAIKADMTKEDSVRGMIETVFDHYGRIDILINNAGQGYDCPLEHVDVAKYRRLFELNVVGPLIAMQSVIPIMRRQGGGMIVNISSGTSLMYLPYMSAYSSTKRALNALTLTAREELREDNISVGVVYPYITLTDLDRNMMQGPGSDLEPVGEGDSDLPPPDSPEFVAERILELIGSEEPEQYAHEWMRQLH